MGKPIPVPRNAPIPVTNRGMATGEAERSRMVSDWLARQANPIKVNAPKAEQRTIQYDWIGAPNSTSRPGPAFKGLLPERVQVARLRDGESVRCVAPNAGERGARITEAALYGSLPGDADMSAPMGEIAIKIVYDAERDPIAPQFAHEKTKAMVAKLVERRAASDWLCEYSEHAVTSANSGPHDAEETTPCIGCAIAAIMASSRVQWIEVSAGGFVLTSEGKYEWRKTIGVKRLTRASWASAMTTPKGDTYKRPARQVTQRQNFNRFDGWQKVSQSRATYSAG